MLMDSVTSSVVIVDVDTVDSVVPVGTLVVIGVDSGNILVVTGGFVEGELGRTTSFVVEWVTIVE